MSAMELKINGETRGFPDNLNVSAVIAHLGMKTDRVAVELNQAIVPRSHWETTTLKDGDQLEIVHFVGGGVDPWSGYLRAQKTLKA
jgi:sulfur carrier protein